MKAPYTSSLGFVVAFALAASAYGQVPSTNDTSDGSYNTGVGTGSLGGPKKTANGSSNTAVGAYTLTLNINGMGNTAVGDTALYGNTGSFNTAVGSYALENNRSAEGNSAFGNNALSQNTTGSFNTAVGYDALENNGSAEGNSAFGNNALNQNTTGTDNTAAGSGALQANKTGADNTASGYDALFSNTDGQENTASGVNALYFNTSGSLNTASGNYALYSNTTGNSNTAFGNAALTSNSTGRNNTGTGNYALYHNASGSNNIAIGYQADYNATAGSNNIEIGSEGLATDNGVIRIGKAGSQTEVFIAGIDSSKITGSAVYITSGGRLGVLASSERYKTAIAPMGTNIEKLQQLRPVTFKLKSDPKGTIQYGLIAEEVAKVFPELVTRDEKDRIDGVRYEELAPMLLNEVQKQQKAAEVQAEKIDAQAAEIRELKQQLAGIQAALATLQSKDQLVAQR